MGKCARNPMRWNCQGRGCFNVKRRPKIEEFAECFPGKIAMGDIDGGVEFRGRLLMLEWKSERDDAADGQDIMFRNISRYGAVEVLVAVGNAETMEVTAVGRYAHGEFSGMAPGNLDDLKQLMRDWVAMCNREGTLYLRPYSPLAEKAAA